MLSIIAIILSIINVIILSIGKIYNKNLLYLSLIISFIWCIYGYLDNKKHIFIGNIIIFIMICYILYYN